MKNIVNKSDCLMGLKEAAENFKHIFEKSPDPFWEQAAKECILEYDLVKDIPDDENFIINRAKLLLRSGLYHAAENRLNKIVESQNKKG
jgi:hypothetical protein